jgi:SWIB/MDM2 domain
MPKGQGLTKPMKLSAELAEVVGKKEASRAECIKQLWAYLKKNNLQDPENKQYFTPDKKLAKVILRFIVKWSCDKDCFDFKCHFSSSCCHQIDP